MKPPKTVSSLPKSKRFPSDYDILILKNIQPPGPGAYSPQLWQRKVNKAPK
jgi:hypothetical protein